MERNVKIVGYGQEIELVLINEYEDDFEVKYTHPSTGQECQEIEQIKTGWSFQDNKSNENYQKLIDAIKKMGEDDMTFEWCQDAEVVNIEDTPYGL